MKKFIFCLMLVAVLGVSVQAMVYSKPGLTDRWATVAEENALLQVASMSDAYLKFSPLPSGTQEQPSAAKPSLVMAFKVPDSATSLKLKTIQVWGDGGDSGVTYIQTLRLVDLGTEADTVAGTLASPAQGCKYNSGIAWDDINERYSDSNNLLLAGGGLGREKEWCKWVYTGFGTKQVVDFDFVSHGINLQAGHSYAFEMLLISAVDTVGGFYWSRDGNCYADGAIFRSDFADTDRTWLRGSSSGSGNRALAISVYLVPEPTTIALLCIGGLALLKKRS